MGKAGLDTLVEKISTIQRELEVLKRDILRDAGRVERKHIASLYGALKGGAVTEAMIKEAKRSLFRDLEDL